MTEELQERWTLKTNLDDALDLIDAYKKRVAELEAQCDCEKCYSLARAYRNDNEKLKAQIEKMKCCYNCRHSRTDYEHCKTDKHEKWEIKEK